MDLGLRGKVALVAAASKGLGRAIARDLAAEGASLVMCARNADTLNMTARGIIAETNAPVLAIPADVAKAEDVARVADAALAKFGQVDVLVNNAGGPPAGRFETHDAKAWQAAAELTLFSAIEFTRRLLPGMKERRWGRILNVTSIAVKQPVENLILSNSLRAAVTGWARTLANEVAADGITVNNLMPGYTKTDRVEALAKAAVEQQGITIEQYYEKIQRDIPMGRLGEPREFAALAVFLASKRASYITGQSIAVDGGWIKALI
jgi:3-oxoacyl-[acyl-carrier protein] reductase